MTLLELASSDEVAWFILPSHANALPDLQVVWPSMATPLQV